MKSWASIGRIAAGILVLVAFGVSSRAEAAVGRTVGTYQVSPNSGAATYTIPVWAPRGPNGLQPQIALTYNSQSGNGYMGVGWNVAGLSSIYRCTQTWAQDPAPAPVTLTGSDVFCMDGQRLRLTGGTYGVAGSTYQTEVANFANVTADGTAGSGPGYFEVQGRDGRTYEYGNTADSQVLAGSTGTASMWLLDKVTDRAGNTMTISYSTQNGTAVPSTISWTPTSYSATTYNYTMQFGYGTNVPQSSIYGYVGGTAYSNTNLLTSISVNYTGTLVKQYALTYGQSPTTGRDELTQVQECADAAQTNCLPPTQFTYQSGSLGVSTNANTALSSSAVVDLKTHNDFNGDGLNDLAYCNGGTPNIIYVVMASSSGYGSPIDTGISCTNPLYGDVTGSGQDGILAPNGTDWYYYTWNGSSFSGQVTVLAYDSTAAEYVLADVNGDGLPDLLAGYQTNTTNRFGHTTYEFDIYVRMNASSATTAGFSTSRADWYSTSAGVPMNATMIADTDYPYGTQSFGTLKALDFNGDGKDDIALETITQSGTGYTVNTYELISGSSSFAYNQITTGPASAFGATTFLDFNSDNCTDYAYNSVIYVSGCNGSVTQQIPLGGATIIGAMDWDGDGRTDILVQNGSTIGVYLSEGDGISSLQTTSIPYNSSDLYAAFNADGDGLDDLAVYGGSTVTYYLHNAAGQKPDLLSSVTDGYGNFAKPAYVSMAEAVGATYFEWNDAAFPYQNYMGPLYLVTYTIFSDPSSQPNGTFRVNDYYAGAWTNLQGRGFSGFGNYQTYDGRNGIWTTFGYERAFPYTGMFTREVATQNNTSQELIFNRHDTVADTVLDGTQYNGRYFAYISNATDDEYEVGGPENTQLITTTTSSYGYDSYGNATSIQKTVTDNDPSSPYLGDSWTTTVTNTPDVDAGTWCLSLLSQSQVSYTASNGSSSVTRTKQFSPDLNYCRYTQIVTEPSSSYQVTEAIGYDAFGNINTDTVTGTGMAARQTTANWGTTTSGTGQFPLSVTDATGTATQFNYNFSYGLVSSETDPNGLTTSWQYGDGFGRVTQETRRDGTYTTFVYNDCVNYGGCLMGAHTLALAHFLYNTDGSIQTDGTTYYDEVERPVLWNEMTFTSAGNTWDQNEVRYDSLGRVGQRAAPCFWSGAVTDACPYWTTMSYDILNRVTQMQRPINQNDGTQQTTSYAYEGRTTTITDPYGHARTLVRDVNGWLRQTKDALGYSIILGYDAAGAKTSVTDSLGNALWTGTYAYGISPFLVGESDKDRGVWGYTVDPLGERTAWTDPKGQQFYESYDNLSRPITRTEPDLYSQWTWGTSAARHNVGKLSIVCTGTGNNCSATDYGESDTYDSLGRLYQRSISIPSMGTYTYTWQYNSTTGLLDTLTYPVSTSGQALQLKYSYQAGILASITDVLDSPNVTIWQANAEDPAGQITQETMGNGVVTSRAYDAVTQWLASVQSGPGGGAIIQNQSFLYDEVGNVSQRQDNNLGLSENFYYDNDYRLSYSTLNGTQNLSLNYDPTGDITSRSDVAGGASWTYDPVRLHAVTQAGSSAYQYAYDANGNVTSRQGSSITWSSYNYPTLINDTATSESVSFSYGPDRRAFLEETQSSSGTELAYHIGGLLDMVSSGGVTDFRHYIYAGSEPVAIDSRKSNGTNAFYYLLSDHQGSITGITNSSGTVVVGESFTAYGSRRNPKTWSGAPSSGDLNLIAGVTRQGYTFQDTLGQMGLNDMVGRVQDAITGRFLSADPTLADPANPQDYNRYSYVVNNPLTYVDPTGFDACTYYTETADSPTGQAGLVCSGATVTATPEPQPGVCTACFSPNPAPNVPMPGSFPAPAGPSSAPPSQPQGQPTSPPPPPIDPPAGPQLQQVVITNGSPLPDSGQLQECAGCEVVVMIAGWEFSAGEAVAAGLRSAFSATRTAWSVARGLGQFLKKPFSSKTNSAGGTVWTSEGKIYQSDFKGIVNNGLYDDQDISILSGVHGNPDGSMDPDVSLYDADVKTFGNLPGVSVYNLPSMSSEEVDALLNGQGTIIGGFCNSGICLLGRF